MVGGLQCSEKYCKWDSCWILSLFDKIRDNLEGDVLVGVVIVAEEDVAVPLLLILYLVQDLIAVFDSRTQSYREEETISIL